MTLDYDWIDDFNLDSNYRLGVFSLVSYTMLFTMMTNSIQSLHSNIPFVNKEYVFPAILLFYSIFD